MTENNHKDDTAKTLTEPLIAVATATTTPAQAPPPSSSAPSAEALEQLLASPDQSQGAAWAGGIAGLLVGGPIGAACLAWGAWHLARNNRGDAGDFCRKSGHFVHRMGESIKREWRESRSKNANEAQGEK